MTKARTIAALAALAQESRLDVFRMLVQSGPEGMAAGAIGARLGVPSPTLSFHLNHLRHAGLVTCRRDSRSIIYSADYKAMNDLISYLMDNCCRGDAEQCAPPVCKPANAKQQIRVVAENGKKKPHETEVRGEVDRKPGTRRAVSMHREFRAQHHGGMRDESMG